MSAVQSTPRRRTQAKGAGIAASPEAEGSFIVGLVEALIDDRTAAKQAAVLISPEWLTSQPAALCWHRVVECCNLTAPKLADLVATIRANPDNAAADLVDAAVSLVYASAQKMVSPQSYRVGLPRFAAEIEHAFRQRGLITASSVVAERAAAGSLDLADLDLIDQHTARMRDVLKRRGEPLARLVLVRASEIKCSTISWLWPQRIVGDGLTIITGPVGISKSLISVDVAGRVTTGDKWPDGTGHAPQGSVILFWGRG